MTEIALAIMTVMASVVGWLIKRLVYRIERMESQLQQYVTEPEVRQIIEDKVDPVKERLSRMEAKMDEIIQLLLSRK